MTPANKTPKEVLEHNIPIIAPKRSRRQFLVQAGQLTTAALLTACSQTVRPQNLTEPIQWPQKSEFYEAGLPRPELPDAIHPRLGGASKSLDVQIGQMILAGFNGQQLTPQSSIVQDVQQNRIGSVALFGRNVVSTEQVQTLTRTLQQNAEIPLLISIDQEGGRVRRLGSTFGLRTNFSAAQLGNLNDLEATQSYAQQTAQTLRRLGINLNLAPVVDLNVNPSNPIIGSQGRSFSADPSVVTAQAMTFIEAHHNEGVFCTLKHFPGHGSSTADSHVGFVDVTETWTEDELTPFASIIESGKCDAVMTAHIYNAKLDKNHPATLSNAVVTGILRRQFGFDGVIITDDIQMGAIRRFYDFETAIELSLEAGVDIFAISRYSSAIVDRLFSTVRGLVDQGRIGQERIYASFKRITALKAKLAVTNGQDSRQFEETPFEIAPSETVPPQTNPSTPVNPTEGSDQLDRFLF